MVRVGDFLYFFIIFLNVISLFLEFFKVIFELFIVFIHIPGFSGIFHVPGFIDGRRYDLALTAILHEFIFRHAIKSSQ